METEAINGKHLLVTNANGKSFVGDTEITVKCDVCARRHSNTFNGSTIVVSSTVVTKGVIVVLQVKSHIARNREPNIS